ncbi:MAG TPA: 4Fe-4S ferredoxin, partial [Syntrophomonas sp.]|nr:4Fe-4S ferredoxin [Syntrophomonas sp.]
MERLFKQAGLNKVIDEGDLVAVKLHFGELGNMAYIRPPYLRRLVQIIKKLGGKPFLT